MTADASAAAAPEWLVTLCFNISQQAYRSVRDETTMQPWLLPMLAAAFDAQAGRCRITGNPAGSDTWEVDHPCQCVPCLAAQAGRMREERDRLRESNHRIAGDRDRWQMRVERETAIAGWVRDEANKYIDKHRIPETPELRAGCDPGSGYPDGQPDSKHCSRIQHHAVCILVERAEAAESRLREIEQHRARRARMHARVDFKRRDRMRKAEEERKQADADALHELGLRKRAEEHAATLEAQLASVSNDYEERDTKLRAGVRAWMALADDLRAQVARREQEALGLDFLNELLQGRVARLEEALRSIAMNSCCDSCQEAKRVAEAALAPPAPRQEGE